MRCMSRNKQEYYYCTFKEIVPILDEQGNDTGEKATVYNNPISRKDSISANKGDSSLNVFGNFNDYDKIIIVDDPKCEIDENTVLFVDTTPNYINNVPQFDYIVKRVSRSLNTSAYAISRVKS